MVGSLSKGGSQLIIGRRVISRLEGMSVETGDILLGSDFGGIRRSRREQRLRGFIHSHLYRAQHFPHGAPVDPK